MNFWFTGTAPISHLVRIQSKCELCPCTQQKSNMFPVGVGLRQGCSLSLILFVIFMGRISRCSQGGEYVRYRNLRITSLLLKDAMVLSASLVHGLKHVLEQFAAECEVAGMRVRNCCWKLIYSNRLGVRCCPKCREQWCMCACTLMWGRMDAIRGLDGAQQVRRAIWRGSGKPGWNERVFAWDEKWESLTFRYLQGWLAWHVTPLGVLFTIDEKSEHEIDKWFGAASAEFLVLLSW